MIDSLKNLDVMAGCSGEIEFGRAKYNGRGKNSKLTGFESIDGQAEATKSAKTRPGSAGRKPQIHGFSACAVAKALGRAGLKFDEANRVMVAHGVQMSRASLSVQMGFGRHPEVWEHRGQPALLTDAQVGELRKVAAVL